MLATPDREFPAGATRRRGEKAPQLSLLAPAAESEVDAELAALDVDGLTPLQALTKLYELKAKLEARD